MPHTLHELLREAELWLWHNKERNVFLSRTWEREVENQVGLA